MKEEELIGALKRVMGEPVTEEYVDRIGRIMVKKGGAVVEMA